MKIRAMAADDAQLLADAFAAQGWSKPVQQFARYYADQEAGAYDVLVAEAAGEPVGYLLLKPEAAHGPYARQGIPEIVDFNVLMKCQRAGIGSALLDEAERRAGERVSLAVGLHAGYGAAQRLYIRRGYVPDGSGAWYGTAPLAPYATCVNDDDLILYMLKETE